MSINIKNPEVSRKAQELAAAAGESITEAVGKAIEERLERLQQDEKRKEAAERLREIGRSVAERAPTWWLTWDYDADLYDERGLPK